MTYYRQVAVLVAFCLTVCSTKVKADDELACTRENRGISGGNIVITCQCYEPLMYITLTENEGHGKYTTILTVNASNHAIFYKDSLEMKYGERVKVSADLENGAVNFTFTDIVPSDSGELVISYKRQQDFTDKKISTYIKVFEPPNISGCENTTSIEGNKLSLSCNVSGSEPIITTWFKGKKTWNGKNLTFWEIKREDEGWVGINASNKIENKTFVTNKNIFIHVNFKPESTVISVLKNTSSVFYKGDTLPIMCKADASPPADFLMYMNSKLVQKNSVSHHDGGRPPGFFVAKLDQIGNNTFTCVPTNEVGIGQNQSLSVLVEDDQVDTNESRVKLEIILPVVIVLVVLAAAAAAAAVVVFLKRRRDRLSRQAIEQTETFSV